MGKVVLTPKKRGVQAVRAHAMETGEEFYARLCERLDNALAAVGELALVTPLFSIKTHENSTVFGSCWSWSVPLDTPSWAMRILQEQIARGVKSPAVIIETEDMPEPEPRGRRTTGILVSLVWSLFAALCIVLPFLLYALDTM